jgi:hypothetical protein
MAAVASELSDPDAQVAVDRLTCNNVAYYTGGDAAVSAAINNTAAIQHRRLLQISGNGTVGGNSSAGSLNTTDAGQDGNATTNDFLVELAIVTQGGWPLLSWRCKLASIGSCLYIQAKTCS